MFETGCQDHYNDPDLCAQALIADLDHYMWRQRANSVGQAIIKVLEWAGKTTPEYLLLMAQQRGSDNLQQ